MSTVNVKDTNPIVADQEQEAKAEKLHGIEAVLHG